MIKYFLLEKSNVGTIHIWIGSYGVHLCYPDFWTTRFERCRSLKKRLKD